MASIRCDQRFPVAVDLTKDQPGAFHSMHALLLILFMFSLHGCCRAAAPQAAVPQSARVIVKFADNVDVGRGMEAMSAVLRQHELSFRYLRPLFASTHLYIATGFSVINWHEVLGDLSVLKEIEYAEKDIQMYRQGN